MLLFRWVLGEYYNFRLFTLYSLVDTKQKPKRMTLHRIPIESKCRIYCTLHCYRPVVMLDRFNSCTKYTASQHLLSVFAIQFILFMIYSLMNNSVQQNPTEHRELILKPRIYTMVGINRPTTHTQNWYKFRLIS